MKKTYINPEMDIVKVEPMLLQAMSLNSNESETPGNADAPGYSFDEDED